MSRIPTGAIAALVVSLAATLLSQSVFAQPARALQSVARHDLALEYGIPAQYAFMRNPLPNTPRTWRRGAAVYEQKCASCHGPAGQGDGLGGRSLGTPPANLAWFATLPVSRWDGFMYWTIAQGGQPFRTEMPAYDESLPKNDIWAVIAYIRQALGNTRST